MVKLQHSVGLLTVINVIDGEPQGEELEADEFSIVNGVTTLKLTKAANNLVCLMRNTRFA